MVPHPHRQLAHAIHEQVTIDVGSGRDLGVAALFQHVAERDTFVNEYDAAEWRGS